MGTVYIWCSDTTVSLPISVTFKESGTGNSGTEYIHKNLNSFNCNDSKDLANPDGFARNTSEVGVRIDYFAKDNKGKTWAGYTQSDKNNCLSILLGHDNLIYSGAFFFSQAANIAYPIRVILDNIDTGGILGRSRWTLNCDSANFTSQYYLLIPLDTAGTFPYHADAYSGEKWTGKVTLTKGHCGAVELLGDTTPVPCTQANLTGIWERQDDGLYPHTKGMKVSYNSSFGGLVSYVPAQCCYKNTDYISSFMSNNDCSITEYEYNAACVLSTNINTTVKFLGLKLILVNGVAYRKM